MAICFAALALVLAGCTPPGPRALLDGKALLDEGHYAQAVEKFTLATSLMATNAQAWNYLGLARHGAGDASGAVQAYQQALRLDRELFEAHYNLGCVWLDQNKPEAAKGEFTACTLRRGNSPEAWLKLGAAQYRLGDLAGADESFQKVLRLSPNHPEAFNGLGLVSVQRRRSGDAVKHFNAALKQQADYRPALLNLATVLLRNLNDREGAAQKYREYLALKPRAADWDEVNAVLQTLEHRTVANPPRPAITNPSPVVAAITNGTKLATAPAPVPVKSNPPPVVTKPVPASATTTAEVVRLPPEPVIRTTPVASQPSPVPSPSIVAPAPGEAIEPPPKSEKRGFFSRLNPFRRDPKATTKPTPSSAASTVAASPPSNPPPPAIGTQALSRYTYLHPAVPSAGNRTEAEAAVARGHQAQQARKPSEAVQAFQQAAQADGSFFEAHYNLGLVQYESRDYPRALVAWELALAVQPGSVDARYNFALTLKAAGYAVDAVAELEKVLAANGNETRAHLVLGNLYAEQLRDKVRARVHYQRVLELDSRHPQATQIRYWLVANPA